MKNLIKLLRGELTDALLENQRLRDFVTDIAENGYRYGGLICQEEAQKLLGNEDEEAGLGSCGHEADDIDKLPSAKDQWLHKVALGKLND